MSDPVPGAASAAPPVCPRHPERVSYVRCQRCERPTCPECQVPAPVGVVCVDCARQARKGGGRRSALGFVPSRGKPYLTYGLIAANVLFYVYGMATGFDRWTFNFGLAPVGEFDAPYRWITSGFVHFGILHLGINMFMLFQFGSQLEQVMGRWRFAALYGLSLIGGSVSVLLLERSVPPGLHAGASGAIMGMFAAFAIVLRRLRLEWRSVAITVGIWLVLGFVVPGISWEGHLGGAVTGALVMLAMLRWVGRARSS